MALRRTPDKKDDKPTAAEIAALRREAKKTVAELEKRFGKERLEALLLEGLEGLGEEATAEWWEKLNAEVAEETRKVQRRA